MSRPTPPNVPITVDTLLGAIRHFLEASAPSPEARGTLHLWVEPGDETLRALLNEGDITITIHRAIPGMAEFSGATGDCSSQLLSLSLEENLAS